MRAIFTLLQFTFLLAVATTVRSDPSEVFIPENVRGAYDAMLLTDIQQAAFDPIMKDLIDQAKRAIRREVRKDAEHLDRRVSRRAKQFLKSDQSRLLDILTKEQVPAFDTYRQLVFETLTTRKQQRYPGSSIGILVGLNESDE